MMEGLRGWHPLKIFGEVWPFSVGAKIFDRGYLQHFSTDHHKILHG